jgi:WD40-like Beta Propeller Repeat
MTTPHAGPASCSGAPPATPPGIVRAGWVLGLLAAFACSKGPAPRAPDAVGAARTSRSGEPVVGGLGKSVFDGEAIDLRVSPDGATVSFLVDAEKPKLDGIPPQMRLGVLTVAATDGSWVRKLANGVINVPGGSLVSSDSHWMAYLAGYNTAAQQGELFLADLTSGKAEPIRLGGDVTYMFFSDDGHAIAFVDAGTLKAGQVPNGPFRELAAEVATAEFPADPEALFFRRKSTGGGGLYLASLTGKGAPKKVADAVGDYRFTKDGRTLAFTARSASDPQSYDLFVTDTRTLKPKSIARNATSFRFSPDGAVLAHIEGTLDQQPGELFISSASGEGMRKVGDRVKEFSFAKDSRRLGFRQRYYEQTLKNDQTERLGELTTVALPAGEPKSIARKVSSYQFSADSSAVAYVISVSQPTPSRDLYLVAGDGEAVRLKEWVYDYVFTPKGDQLLFRTDCIRDGRACNLLSTDLSQPAAKPKLLSEGIFGFVLSTDGQRVLVLYPRMQTGEVYDVGVYNLGSGQRKTLEQQIRLPAFFLDGAGSKVAYTVVEPGRRGVYVASQVP